MGYGEALNSFAVTNEGEKRFFVWTSKKLIDGWSIEILRNMLERIYRGDPIQSAVVDITQLVRYRQIMEVNTARAYFKGHLAGAKFKPSSTFQLGICVAQTRRRRIWLALNVELQTTLTYLLQ